MARQKVVPTVRVAGKAGGRMIRRPSHTWSIKQRPHVIQPIALIPVVAGDSIRSLRWENRVLTSPINSQVEGWWCESYAFLVPLSAFLGTDRTDAAALLVDPSESASAGSLPVATLAWTYHFQGGVNWCLVALKPIIERYFRKEGQAWNASGTTVSLGGETVPIAALPTRSVLDAIVPDATAVGTAPVDWNADDDYEGRWAVYEELRRQKLITMTYEEYLRSEGVAVPAQLAPGRAADKRPELLHYSRQFSYPSNTVNPADATVQATAVSWVQSERLPRPIYCAEPGFIVLVSVVRPKWYSSTQRGGAWQLLKNARLWLPSAQDAAPQESLVLFTNPDSSAPHDAYASGLFAATVEAYGMDVNGYLTMGDQFIVGTPDQVVASPAVATLAHGYPTLAEIEAVFASDTLEVVNQDGRAIAVISGHTKLGITPTA